jgi:transposase
MRNQDGSKTFVLKHNVIIIEPFQIKQFAKVLNDAIARYEVEYGAIEMPNAIKKAETDLKKLQKQQVNPKGHDVPSYLG